MSNHKFLDSGSNSARRTGLCQALLLTPCGKCCPHRLSLTCSTAAPCRKMPLILHCHSARQVAPRSQNQIQVASHHDVVRSRLETSAFECSVGWCVLTQSFKIFISTACDWELWVPLQLSIVGARVLDALASSHFTVFKPSLYR